MNFIDLLMIWIPFREIFGFICTEKTRFFHIYILWATPSAAGPRPLHSRIAESRHCCKRILAFFGTSTCHLRIFGLFGTLGSITKDTLRSRLGFLLISGGFCCPWLLFGCLVPLLWRPGGPWEDPGTILGHGRAQGRTLLGPGSDFIDFLMI